MDPGPAVFAKFEFERIGGGLLSESFRAEVRPQPVPSLAERPWEGYKWNPTTSFTVPTTWPSGLYRVKATPDGGGADPIADFVVRPANPGAGSKILLQVSFNSPNAYCVSGGYSLYWGDGPGGYSRAEKVSFDRPGIQIPDAYEIAFLRWLTAKGIAVDCCSSVDLHRSPALLSSYNLLLSVGHDEYWTKEMRDHVEAFVRNGGNVAFFSGNTAYRQVRLEQDERMLVFYKYASKDPLRGKDDDRVTVAFNQHPVCRPPNALLGVGFSDGAGCWDNDYGADDAYTIRAPDHWVFEGVAGPTLGGEGLRLMGKETDAAPLIEEPEGYARPSAAEGTPRCFTPLATADMRDGWMNRGKSGMATLGLHIRNGTVFTAGTMGWTNALAQSGAAADKVKRVTENVVRRLANRSTWEVWEHIGHANHATAMTALDGKLYLATREKRLGRRYPLGANVAWKDIGQAVNVVALAGDRERLFSAQSDNSVWWRRPVEEDIIWTPLGQGPAAGVRAMAATNGLLYAVDKLGVIWVTPVSTSSLAWQKLKRFVTPNAKVRCLAATNDTLFAATDDNKLLRTDNDFIFEATRWIEVHHAFNAAGIAAIDTMLFAATTDDKLWWIDFLHFYAP